MHSLKQFLKIPRLSYLSYNKFTLKFFGINENKNPNYGGLDIKDSAKEEANKKECKGEESKSIKSSKEEEGKTSKSGGISMSSEQIHQTRTDSALNFMSTGLGETMRSKNHPIDELILADHKDLKVYLRKFEESPTFEEASRWLHQFIWDICRHSIAEEIILYPILKKVPDGKHKWNESLEEHRKIKELLSQVQKIQELDLLKAKVKEVTDVLMHHMEFEEKEVLPAINSICDKDFLIKEGNRFLRRKFIAPTRPHTMTPDSFPTLESLGGLLLSPIDKFRDIFFESFPDQNEVDKIKTDNSKNPKP
jgi:hemerythrin superfamily protein